MKIEKLKPGMTVYDAHKYKMGNTNISTVGIWTVYIIQVDHEKRTVTASWNSNPQKTYYERDWSKWRIKRPELIEMPLGNKRIARRKEIHETHNPRNP